MYKSIALSVFISASALAQESDQRQTLNLTPPQRQFVLNEMRGLLGGTQSIIAALAKDDMTAVAEAARAMGFDMKHKAENPMHDVLPKEFMMLGMSMHRDFDTLAADALAKKDPKYTLKQLSDIMGKCNACHATYQIQTAPPSGGQSQADAARLDEVAARGRHVMPFDLEQTRHVFSKTGQGGLQQVIVKDPANIGQIQLIRQHLRKISGEFTQRDFSGPQTIHGNNMPGLAQLQNAPSGDLNISYNDLNNGGEIRYSSQKPEIIDAIHRFFDAQLSDHARHAETGHTNHAMH
jgi:hypothetical protein